MDVPVRRRLPGDREIVISPPFAWQRKFLAMPSKRRCARIGRRGGKSNVLARWLATGELGFLAGKPVALMAPQTDQLALVEFELLNLYGQILAKHGDDSYLCAPSGGRIDLWTLHNNARELAGRGYKYGKIAIDEAAYARNLERAFQATIEPTLADYNGDCVITSTPKGTKNDFYRFCRRWPCFVGATDLNPSPNIRAFLEQKRRDAAVGRLHSKIFRQEYLAEFVDLTEALVGVEMISEFELDPVFPHEDWSIAVGVDLGISQKEEADYTAIVTIARHRMKGHFAVVNVQRGHWPAGEVKEKIRAVNRRYSPVVICIESVQFQAAWVREFLTQAPELPIVERRPEKDKVVRFQAVQQKYALGLVYHLIDLPSSFQDELVTFPIGEHDDQVDALVYAFTGFENYMGKPKSGDVWGTGYKDRSREEIWWS